MKMKNAHISLKIGAIYIKPTPEWSSDDSLHIVP